MKASKLGFLQALGVAAYISLVGVFMWQGGNFLPKVGSFFGPILVLLLFSTSALICGLMVFYKPYKLFFAGKKKEAADVVISTSVWLFAFLAVYILSLIIFR